MEDINAKREARRRHILENSQKRLSKITGHTVNTESEDISSVDTKEGTLESSVNGIISDKYNDRIKDTNGFTLDETLNNILTSKYKHNYARNEFKDSQCPSTPKRFFPFILLTNRSNYVILAIIVNVLLVLQKDYLFGKAIVIPCFLILLGRLYAFVNLQETQNDSLLYTIFILCNIKPEVTYQFRRLISILHIILGDLALYIFSFTIIHYGLLHCLHYTDIPST